ncbi:MAG: FAD-dependent oxidoreductase [Deinococcales bacterium]
MSRHVVVIGAGVVGLFSALYARRAGFEVTVVDREGSERSTTSYGNAGLVVPSHIVPLAAPGAVAQGLRWMFDAESPFYVRPELDPELLTWGWRFWRASTAERARRAGPVFRDLHRASKAEYLDLAARLGGSFDLAETGVVILCATEKGLEGEARVAARATVLGMAPRVLGRSEVQALQPGVQLDVVGGVYYPEDARLDPGRLMRALQAHLEEIGVAFRWGVRVDGMEVTGDRVQGVRVTGIAGAEHPIARDAIGGVTITADEVVLAAGVWSEGLARSVGLRLPMRAGKGYSMTLRDPPERPSTPALLAEGHVAVTPLETGVRFGGTMELTGTRGGVNARRVRGIVRSVQRVFPAITPEAFANEPVWYGFRPCSPDGLPYLGRSGSLRNLVVATGHAMIGVSLAPVTGKLVAELLAGSTPSLPLEALSPDRYA